MGQRDIHVDRDEYEGDCQARQLEEKGRAPADSIVQQAAQGSTETCSCSIETDAREDTVRLADWECAYIFAIPNIAPIVSTEYGRVGEEDYSPWKRPRFLLECDKFDEWRT